MPPDVSFIVAAFNASATIRRSIESALATRGVSFEIIAVDDCSNDDTRQVLQSIRDPRLRWHTLSKNGGPGTARNAALEDARGRFVAVLDADDEVAPDRMARLVSRLDQTGAAAMVDNIDLRISGSADRATMFPRHVLENMGALSLSQYIMGNRLFAGGYNFGYFKPVVRRSFLQEHGVRYPEAIRIGEDYLFLAACLAKGGKCLVSGEIGYLYNVTPGSISRVLHLAHVKAMLAMDEEFVRAHPLSGADVEAQRARTRSLTDAVSFLSIVEALKNGSPAMAFGHAARNPRAARHLSMPVMARFQRLVAAIW